MAPKFELGRDFCTMHLTTKFHYPNRSEVIVLTNKQTDSSKNIYLAVLCYAGWVNIFSSRLILHFSTEFPHYRHIRVHSAVVLYFANAYARASLKMRDGKMRDHAK